VEGSESREPAGLAGRAQLSVRWGPIWPGGFVYADLALEDGCLRIEVAPQQLGRTQRRSVARLLGDDALNELEAGEPVSLRVDPAEAELSFRATKFTVELGDKPTFALLFLDMSSVEEVAGRPGQTLTRTVEALGGRGDAKAAVAAWRRALGAGE
jgi:hypothetical protein